MDAINENEMFGLGIKKRFFHHENSLVWEQVAQRNFQVSVLGQSKTLSNLLCS